MTSTALMDTQQNKDKGVTLVRLQSTLYVS